TRPCHAAIEKILTTEPGSEKDPDVADWRVELALYDRALDTPGTLAAALSKKDAGRPGFYDRLFSVALVARLKGDETSARAAYMKVRIQVEEEMRFFPDDIYPLSGLGLIDAALGRKAEALSE